MESARRRTEGRRLRVWPLPRCSHRRGKRRSRAGTNALGCRCVHASGTAQEPKQNSSGLCADCELYALPLGPGPERPAFVQVRGCLKMASTRTARWPAPQVPISAPGITWRAFVKGAPSSTRRRGLGCRSRGSGSRSGDPATWRWYSGSQLVDVMLTRTLNVALSLRRALGDYNAGPFMRRIGALHYWGPI